MTDLTVLLSQYELVDEQLKLLEDKKTTLRNNIAEYLHNNELNSINQYGASKLWKCEYQTRTTKSVDYAKLVEFVGQENYTKIVSMKESTSLIIKSIKEKVDDSDLTSKSPKKTSKTPIIPTGVMS